MRNFQNTFETCKRSFISAFCEKNNNFLMFLVNLIFVVSQLKIHPGVHLNTVKALTLL